MNKNAHCQFGAALCENVEGIREVDDSIIPVGCQNRRPEAVQMLVRGKCVGYGVGAKFLFFFFLEKEKWLRAGEK